MKEVSSIHRAIYDFCSTALGGEHSVFQFLNQERTTEIDVLQANNAPQSRVVSYATIGLSDWPLFFRGDEFPVRLELLGACSAGLPTFPNALAAAAFNIIEFQWFCAPGVIFPGVLGPHNPGSHLEHLIFFPPFLWEDLNTTIEIVNRKITWLLAVPISTKEMDFADKNGPNALEELFEVKQIDIFNPVRPSVVT